MPERFPIFQFPNPPLILAMATGVLARATGGTPARAASLTSDVALLVWAAQEIVDGANWVRRLIGVGGGAVAAMSLSRDLSQVLGA